MESVGCLSVADRHPPDSTIYLKRHHTAHRMHRYYLLTVEPNLFGEWSLIREWGGIGKPSCRRMIDLHATEQDAQAAMAHKCQEKRRRGYR
jgi:predicted DNA-binding WGR domain protein